MARRRCRVLVPLGSRVNPGHSFGLLLLPPRSQDPTSPSAPQEATDGSKVVEPLGEPLPTACLTLPTYPLCPVALLLLSPGLPVWSSLLFHVSGLLSFAQPPVRFWSLSETSRPPSEGQAVLPTL